MINYILVLITLSFSVYAFIKYRRFNRTQADEESKAIVSRLAGTIMILSGMYAILLMMLNKLAEHGSFTTINTVITVAYILYIISIIAVIIYCIKLRIFIQEKSNNS